MLQALYTRLFQTENTTKAASEPEVEFLRNSATMTLYAKRELQQFLDWTRKDAAYNRSAQAIIQKLHEVSGDIDLLRKEYDNR